ncbi:MAG: hypothetical protein HC880_18795 [Bacteroidia bacterium]|nr:hypothetical protein [Bacteroidia bacterium]
MEDSLTYDLTAWALPYVYGIDAYAVAKTLAAGDQPDILSFQPNTKGDTLPYAYLVPWHDLQQVQFLAALLKANIQVRYTKEPLHRGHQAHPPGTLIIARADNPVLGDKLDDQLIEIANRLEQPLLPIRSGWMTEGKDLGSSALPLIKSPKVALLAGAGVSTTDLGAIWHYFEQDLQFPLHILNKTNANAVDLHQFDVLILVSGKYDDLKTQLFQFAQQGGKIIAIEDAVSLIADDRSSLIHKNFEKMKENQEKAEGEPGPNDEKLT